MTYQSVTMTVTESDLDLTMRLLHEYKPSVFFDSEPPAVVVRLDRPLKLRDLNMMAGRIGFTYTVQNRDTVQNRGAAE